MLPSAFSRLPLPRKPACTVKCSFFLLSPLFFVSIPFLSPVYLVDAPTNAAQWWHFWQLSGTRIRQGVVNGLVVCKSSACGPLRGPGRLAKGCFCGSHRLLKGSAFRGWKRS